MSEELNKPKFGTTDGKPVDMTHIRHEDGRMSSYPPSSEWEDWVEWDAKAWPKKVPRRYSLVPTVCFNCESACGLLAYVDKTTYEIRRFEGNPAHPGSRGRNCAKGPATHNQIYDPERLLYPLKRVGARGEGKWKRITWDQAISEISEKMRKSRKEKENGIVYHVGRPGEDGYTNRVVQSWGVDGHNSHTNICSAAARAGYFFWAAFDRPSPDYANARAILLISSHLETGHYFNPHAQRIIEAQRAGAKIITMDPRLSNTASKSDIWLPTWPGSEAAVLLAIASHLLQTGQYDREFVRNWVNWQAFLEDAELVVTSDRAKELIQTAKEEGRYRTDDFDVFEELLIALYSEFTFERAAEESQVSVDRIRAAAEAIANCGGRLAAHNWRAASMGNRGGWQVTRCLFFLNVLTGSVGVKGGTSGNSWNKFVPSPFSKPPPLDSWNELHLPHEWPFAMYEMSFLLPHFLAEGRGDIDVYFTRVYNPLWINPDGFMWIDALKDEEKIKCHVALTPTWNESAWYADYVLPMGHASERHDLMSQETHAGQWIAFRQPVKRVAMEKAGIPIDKTWQANPGEVWEENEFWIDLSAAMDPDGSLGVREHFISPYRKDEIITVEEYYRWIFENSVPGLPEAAKKEGLTPLGYMRKYGAFEVVRDNYIPYMAESEGGPTVGGKERKGFGTPSGKLEFYSRMLKDWGWPEQEYCLPWPLKSHVHPEEIDRKAGEMILLPNFRLPTLIHTRSANCKWLYEISHRNPVWMHTSDGARIGVKTGDLIRVETEIGYFIAKVWVGEAIKPGIVAMSHHMGRWRLQVDAGVNRGSSAVASLAEDGTGRSLQMLGGATAWESWDADTSRIWWQDVGVHQNLTHCVQPDPISGAHCWLQKALSVRKALPGENYGDVHVDTSKSVAIYHRWYALTRSAVDHSPDGTRRPRWLKRPLKPTVEAYKLPDKPFGR
jgi:anaerobic selenocysteine-containing dehydrogenase